jgi:hypothetical protein
MKVKVLLMSICGLLIFGCTTSRSASMGIDIGSLYHYGYISELVEYGGSARLYGMDVEIFQLIQEAGIKMLGEGEIAKLTDDQKAQLMTIKYGVSSSFFESVVTITFFDYNSKRPLLNCTGSSAWGLPSIDIPAAKKNALEQMKTELKRH